MIDRDSTTGRAITWLQFPLAILVFTAHALQFRAADYPLPALISFIAWTLPNVTVPTFFFISGYLFFAGRETFGPSDYLKALRRRARTLLLPYVLWMLISYFTYALIHKTLYPFGSLSDIYNTMWGGAMLRYQTSIFGTSVIYKSMSYMLYPLWFVRDLMCVSLISPLIWLMGRYLRLWALIPMTFIYLAGLGTNITGFQPEALFYFPAGALMAITGRDIARLSRKALPVTLPVWLLLSVVYTWLFVTFDINHVTNGIKSRLEFQMMCMFGVCAVIGLAVAAVEARRPGRLLTRVNTLFTVMAPTAMFIYITHTYYLAEILRQHCEGMIAGTGKYGEMWLSLGLGGISANPGEWGSILLFGTIWVVQLSAILATCTLLRRYAPRTLSVLTGGRSDRTCEAAVANYFKSALSRQ